MITVLAPHGFRKGLFDGETDASATAGDEDGAALLAEFGTRGLDGRV